MSEKPKRCEVCYEPLDYRDIAKADFDSWVFKTVRTYLPCSCEQEDQEELSA